MYSVSNSNKKQEDTVKKLRLVVALAALAGLAVNSFADVQNIRLSGDIRIRGYYLSSAAGDIFNDQVEVYDSFIEQRTRVTVEADLEDHVLVVVTMKAQGLWGDDNNETFSSGAGTGFSGTGVDAVNRRWGVGVTEAYVQLNEVFYSAATLKLGRQYLNYGRGLILSSTDNEYNYDAARLVLDYYPLTLDVVYSKAVENSSFGSGSTARDVDLLFVNGRYEMTDSLIKDVEAYFAYLANNNNAGGSLRVPPSAAAGDSPMLIGLRTDMNLTEGLTTWAEGAYEFGSATSGHNISAFLANIGARFALKDAQWAPVFNAAYTYASGGGNSGQHNFRPWFNYEDGYNGYLFAPMLSNIHIFNVGATVKPCENTSLSVQGYYYAKANVNSAAGSDRNIDFGGLGFTPASSGSGIGWEIDTILGYDYSKDVRAQFVYALFLPGNGGFDGQVVSPAAQELRAELNVKF